MIIAICGSTQFHEQMQEVRKKLEAKGHKVFMPHLEFGDFHRIRDTRREEWRCLKPAFMKDNFEKIKTADAVLILNYDKGKIKNYIGGNTFMEITIAFEYGKKIFLLNPMPTNLPYSDEIEVMNPVILNGSLDILDPNAMKGRRPTSPR